MPEQLPGERGAGVENGDQTEKQAKEQSDAPHRPLQGDSVS